jgi:hypothetical protein
MALGDWFGVFRDLRFFFYVHELPPEHSLSVHLLAVQEDGGEYLAQHVDQLLERRELVLALLEGESSSP